MVIVLSIMQFNASLHNLYFYEEAIALQIFKAAIQSDRIAAIHPEKGLHTNLNFLRT